MKKALIVTTVSGFVPQFEMGNVRILQSMGYEVHYASNFRNPSYGKDNSRLKGTGIVGHQVDFARSPFQIRENARAYRQLRQLLKEQHFELLHCHTPVGAALARLAARHYRRSGSPLKVLYTAHGFHFYKGAPLKYWLLFYPVERWLANFTDVLVTINEEDYRRAKRFCKHKKTKVEHIAGVGIDTAYFAGKDLQEGEREAIRHRVREELHVGEDETMFLSVGELIPRKNHSAVIRELGKRKKEKFRYFICGKGVLEEALKKQIDAAGLTEKVRLLGYREDIRELLYAADVFVFPSLQEGMPVALLEAVAAGVPAIASDIRGSRELLGKQKGAAAFTDAEGLKRALGHALEIHIKTFAGRKEPRQGQGEKETNAGQTSDNRMAGFDIQQVGRRMKNIYKEVGQ